MGNKLLMIENISTENQQIIINGVIEVKIGVYSHETQTNIVNNDRECAEFK